MVNRRAFLKASVAVSAWPALAGTVGSKPAASPFYKVVFDRRYAAAQAFAREAQSRGWAVHGIEGDVTNLFFRDLDLRWKAGPVAMAGLTVASSLFCLEMLARDRGMRLMHRTEHAQLSGGKLAPEVRDVLDWHSSASALPVAMPLSAVTDPAGQLISWILAPRAGSAS